MKNKGALAILSAAVAVFLLSPTATQAGEFYLGTINVTDAGSVNNGLTATTFYINPQATLTIQCDAGAYVITDRITVGTADSGPGILLNAGQAFPTSINGPKNLPLRDAGVQANAGIVAVKPASGATVGCDVYSTKGNE